MTLKELRKAAHYTQQKLADRLGVDAGVDIKTAQKLLGHTSPEITMRIYTHLSEAREASSIGKMEAFLRRMGSGKGSTPTENPTK